GRGRPAQLPPDAGGGGGSPDRGNRSGTAGHDELDPAVTTPTSRKSRTDRTGTTRAGPSGTQEPDSGLVRNRRSLRHCHAPLSGRYGHRMRLERPHRAERFGAVRIHELQRILELDGGYDKGDETAATVTVSPEEIREAERDMVVVVP